MKRGRISPFGPWARRGGGEEHGSVVVAALAFAVVAAVVVGAAAARSLSGVDGARGLHERELARALAEHGAAVALARLDAGGAAAALGTGSVLEMSFPVEDPRGDSETDSASELTVHLSASDPREQILLRSEARVGRAHHVVTAELRPRSTVDQLLLSVHEVVDPALRSRPRSDCAAGRGEVNRAVDCIATSVGPGVYDGPVHSNDAIEVVPGTTFLSSITTSHLDVAPDGRIGPSLWSIDGYPSVLAAPFGLRHRTDVVLPREVRDAIGATVVTCRFRGPTLLRFDGQRLRVTSPRSVPRVGEVTSPGEVIGCLGVDRSELSGAVTVELPPRTVIEVVRDPLHDCVDHPLGIEHGEDTERDWWCSGGDAFVWGRYRGAHTVLAEDYVQIVWDLEPGDSAGAESALGNDLLGLVAGESIVLRRPVGRPVRRTAPYGLNLAFSGPGIAPFGAYPLDAPTAVPMTWDEPRIVASLAALRGSVGVQNPFRGQVHPGPVRLEGSLAMRFRGVFSWEDRNDSGTLLGDMGYGLDLVYDRRLLTRTPPAMPLTDGGAVRIIALDAG